MSWSAGDRKWREAAAKRPARRTNGHVQTVTNGVTNGSAEAVRPLATAGRRQLRLPRGERQRRGRTRALRRCSGHPEPCRRVGPAFIAVSRKSPAAGLERGRPPEEPAFSSCARRQPQRAAASALTVHCPLSTAPYAR